MNQLVITEKMLSGTPPEPGAYEKPAHGWTCFHCGEAFTSVDSARDHFGISEHSDPGCLLKVSVGAERGMLQALRKAEERITQYMIEDVETTRSMYAMQTRHSAALNTAEELGYERGLADMRKENIAIQSWQANAATALGDSEKALKVLFTMLTTAGLKQGAVVADEILGSVSFALKELAHSKSTGQPAPKTQNTDAAKLDRFSPGLYVKSSGYNYGARMTLDPCGHYVEHTEYLRLAAKLVKAQKEIRILRETCRAVDLQCADELIAQCQPAPKPQETCAWVRTGDYKFKAGCKGCTFEVLPHVLEDMGECPDCGKPIFVGSAAPKTGEPT